MTAARRRLPARRQCETFSLECAGLSYVATVSRFDDGSIGEIFLSNHKSGSAADVNARDAAIAVSFASIIESADGPDIRQARAFEAKRFPTDVERADGAELRPCARWRPRIACHKLPMAPVRGSDSAGVFFLKENRPQGGFSFSERSGFTRLDAMRRLFALRSSPAVF